MSSTEDGRKGCGQAWIVLLLCPTLGVLSQVVGIRSGWSGSELEDNPGVNWSRCWDLISMIRVWVLGSFLHVLIGM